MIPLRDNIPSRTVPIVNYAMIAACTLVFLAQLADQADGDAVLVERLGMIPARVLHPSRASGQSPRSRPLAWPGGRTSADLASASWSRLCCEPLEKLAHRSQQGIRIPSESPCIGIADRTDHAAGHAEASCLASPAGTEQTYDFPAVCVEVHDVHDPPRAVDLHQAMHFQSCHAIVPRSIH